MNAKRKKSDQEFIEYLLAKIDWLIERHRQIRDLANGAYTGEDYDEPETEEK